MKKKRLALQRFNSRASFHSIKASSTNSKAGSSAAAAVMLNDMPLQPPHTLRVKVQLAVADVALHGAELTLDDGYW